MKKIEDYKEEYQKQESALGGDESWWYEFLNCYNEKQPIFYEAALGVSGNLMELLKKEGWKAFTDGLAECGEILPPGADPQEYGYFLDEEED